MLDRRRLLLLVPAAGLGASLAQTALAQTALAQTAARTPDKDMAVLAALWQGHITPRVKAFADAATATAAALAALAAAPDAGALDAARAAYHTAMDAWAGVQHLRPGPLLQQQRTDRIAFWPERRGIVARQLGQLVTARDPKPLDAMGQQSAAVQGLTALERLLFDEGITAASFGGDDAGRYRGALGAAIARNIATLAGEVQQGWAEIGPAMAAGRATPVGANATEAVNNLYTSAITMTQIVVDLKILAPLGANLADAKPAVAEATRSGRSLRSIALNLKALRAFLAGEGGSGIVALLPQTAEGRAAALAADKAFTDAVAAVEAVSKPLDVAVADKQARPSVEAAFRAAKGAQTTMNQKLPPLLGIVLGFNELDGD